MAKFLNKPITPEQLEQLTEYLRFDNFSKNESVNFESGKKMGFMQEDGHFIRKGESKFLLIFEKKNYQTTFNLQEKRAIGKTISVRN